jgi:hypothetical protein
LGWKRGRGGGPLEGERKERGSWAKERKRPNVRGERGFSFISKILFFYFSNCFENQNQTKSKQLQNILKVVTFKIKYFVRYFLGFRVC